MLGPCEALYAQADSFFAEGCVRKEVLDCTFVWIAKMAEGITVISLDGDGIGNHLSVGDSKRFGEK